MILLHNDVFPIPGRPTTRIVLGVFPLVSLLAINKPLVLLMRMEPCGGFKYASYTSCLSIFFVNLCATRPPWIMTSTYMSFKLIVIVPMCISVCRWESKTFFLCTSMSSVSGSTGGLVETEGISSWSTRGPDPIETKGIWTEDSEVSCRFWRK